MRLATYNVNGINGRLPVVLEWLAVTRPDVVCLQELKAPDERFPAEAIEQAGYGAIWHGQKSWNGVAILARGATPQETRRGLPGDPDDSHSRYLEAPVILAGDYNIIPTPAAVYKPERWTEDALFAPEVRAQFEAMQAQGWTDAIRTLYPGETIFTFWDYFRNAFARDAGLRLDHLMLNPVAAKLLKHGGVDRSARAPSPRPATTPRPGSSSPSALHTPPGTPPATAPRPGR